MPKGIFKRTKKHIENNRKSLKKYYKTHFPPNKGKHHSEETKEKISKILSIRMIGINNPNWKNGVSKTSSGYIKIYSPNHPFRIKQYVLQHRLIMERHLGRYLNSKEIVHHINGNPTDNRLKNLCLMQKKEHDKYETKNRWNKDKKSFNRNFISY